MKLLINNIEYVALALNASIFVAFLVKRPIEPGKVLYWLGAAILTIGLIKMRG